VYGMRVPSFDSRGRCPRHSSGILRGCGLPRRLVVVLMISGIGISSALLLAIIYVSIVVGPNRFLFCKILLTLIFFCVIFTTVVDNTRVTRGDGMKRKMIRFLRYYDACGPGFDWAVKKCTSMQEVWDAAKDDWLLWVAVQGNVMDAETIRRFNRFTLSYSRRKITDPFLKGVAKAALDYYDGKITEYDRKGAQSIVEKVLDELDKVDYPNGRRRNEARTAHWACSRVVKAAGTGQPMIPPGVGFNYVILARWLRKHVKPNFNIGRKE
jgi:hypothetical protein